MPAGSTRSSVAGIDALRCPRVTVASFWEIAGITIAA
jgi:hypothetical protein